MKKKPLHTKELAHGKSTENGQANWISAVATLINTDILASGEFYIDELLAFHSFQIQMSFSQDLVTE